MSININHSTNTITSDLGTVAFASNFGFKNRIINGLFQISQRGTGAQTVVADTTVPTVSTGYQVDRWFCYSIGANVTITAPVTFGGITTGQINGAASVTEIGLGQRIETFNVQDVANQQMTLSFSMANSLLTSMTLSVWTANTSDTFGTIVAPTKTQVGATTFTITSTLTPYTYTFTAPTNSINGIEVLFVVGAQTSGTWNIGNVQLELGNSATPIDQRPISSELFMCQRYLETIGINGFQVSGYNPTAAASNNYGHIPMSVTKRVSPTISSLATSRYTGTNANNIFYSTSTNAFAFSIQNIAAGYWTYQNIAILTLNAEL